MNKNILMLLTILIELTKNRQRIFGVQWESVIY